MQFTQIQVHVVIYLEKKILFTDFNHQFKTSMREYHVYKHLFLSPA